MTSASTCLLVLLAAPAQLAAEPQGAGQGAGQGAAGEQGSLPALERRVAQLEAELGEARKGAAPPDGASTAAADEIQAAPFGRDPNAEPPALRGVYDKPFLGALWRRAHVGGYTELEYHSFEDGILGIPEGFRMHRTNLFLFAEVSDTVRFGSELEFETEFDGESSSDIDVAVEMAFVDWQLFEEFTVRGGALLVPLGRININHDGPIRELTERPLVSTFVMPTTFTEPGIGAQGTFTLADSLLLTYEGYAVNGLSLLDSDGELAVDLIDKEQLLREGRTGLGGDSNGSVAGTGRVAVRALRRLELGGSFHLGTYDERDDNLLAIVAGDAAAAFELGGLELGLEGEIALASFERDDFAETAGVPDQFWGWYVQAGIGGLPGFLRAIPYVFDGDGARVGAVLRYDWVDLDKDEGQTIEPGITFRPVADTVFKLSYKFTLLGIGERDIPGRRHFDDDGFVFSLTSYF